MATLSAAAPPAAHPSLTVSHTQFALDRTPTWLTGVSLFDALGPVPPRDADLDAIKTARLRIVRVWAHWHESIHAPDGSLTAEGGRRLRELVDRLAARRLILELVVLRPGELPGQAYAAFASADARVNGVKAVATALKDDRNVLFDLYNEHDHPDGPISHADLRVLRDAVKAIDPQRVVTVSSTESHLIEPNGTMTAEQAKNLLSEAGAGEVGVDVLAAHLPRTGDFAGQTEPRVRVLRRALDAIGAALPIYLNEPRRAQPDRPLPEGDYAKAAAGARAAGAAGWILHTDAGFELKTKSFLDALRPEERRGLEAVGKIDGG